MPMNVTKISEGLWQWTTEDGAATLWSTYAETADATVLIDPRLPADPDERERFWTAFDRDVQSRERPVRVLLTGDPDDATITALRERYELTVSGPVADRDRRITPIPDGTAPAEGIICRTLTAPTGDRRAIFLATEHSAVIIGDFPESAEHRRTLVTHIIESTTLRAKATGEEPPPFRHLLSSIAASVALESAPAS